MADEEQQEIENALNTIASSTEQSTKMKKELKQTIYDTVSTLRKLFVKLKEVSDSKTRMITELQTMLTTTKAQLTVARDNSARALAKPSIAQVRELARTEGRVGAPSDAEAAMQHKAGTDHGKLYSEALRGKVKHTLHTLTVSSKENKSADTKKF